MTQLALKVFDFVVNIPDMVDDYKLAFALVITMGAAPVIFIDLIFAEY